MKKLALLLLILPLALGATAQGELLRQRLDVLLSDPMFETSQVGLMVYDLTADQVLYERNSRQLMRPASTMKLLTAITALDYLGSDYLFSTRLHYTGQIDNGVLRGNIFCVGGFDPMVSDGDINAMAGNLRAMGIDRVEGYIVADQSMKDTLSYGEGWCWDDKNPRLLPLTVGRKDVFPERLQRELADVGVATDAVVLANGTCPVQSTLVCQSCHTMDQVLERMMKMSDNFYAEAMFYQIAAAAGKGPARADAAVEVVRQLIRRLGLDDSIYRIADGSGLSLYNYLSAELETQLLRYAWRNGHIYAHLAPSLPVAGVDGTLKKRMLKTAAKGNVHAKTGTLTGISSLAGYCTAANGHTLAFAIINQGVMQSQRAKSFQDRVCTALCETE